MNIAVFVSGRGSNLKAILEADELTGKINVVSVLSNKKDCKAFNVADDFSIPHFVIGDKDDELSFNSLPEFLKAKNVELIVLAGFLKLIPSDFIESFKNKIINIHPALLPSFGGKGMYGSRVHQAVYESSAKVSGATVHFVDNSYDTGKIIAQRCVNIFDVSSPDEIAERVLKIEHQLLPEVVQAFAEDRVKFENNRVTIK